MTKLTLNLPVDIPWKLITASPDMMDTTFGNKRFPFKWRSSLAISAFEPNLADLPNELADERITFLKITSTITGYQPSAEEVATGFASFPDIPVEDLNRILEEYFACYGVLLEVAVFPYKEGLKRISVDFSQEPEDIPLPNPYHRNNVTFTNTSGEDSRVGDMCIVASFSMLGDRNSPGQKGLYMYTEDNQMEINCPETSRVEIKLVLSGLSISATIQAYCKEKIIDTKQIQSETEVVEDIVFEGQEIDHILIKKGSGCQALVGFAYFIKDDCPISLYEYPHIIDFEPKSRDLYQMASETGEILTASLSEIKTGKSLTHAEKTDTGIDVGSSYNSGQTPYGIFQGDWRVKRNWAGEDQENRTTNTDASRERRESQSTTTQISQMYNLLTGYHLGTNRATFLMLPRPHILQATPFRTFQQGLRMIEGIQEFFLVVSRPRTITGLAVEVLMQTGHFSEKTKIEEPPTEYDLGFEDFTVNVHANSGVTSGETKKIQDDDCSKHSVQGGWVIDRSSTRESDPEHPGIKETRNDSNKQADNSLREYNYQTVEGSDTTVQITGTIEGAARWGPGAQFCRSYRIYTRSAQPKPSKPETKVTTTCLTASRSLSGMFISGDKHIEPVHNSSMQNRQLMANLQAPEAMPIVDERTVVIDPGSLSLNGDGVSKSVMVKEALRQIQLVLTTGSKQREYRDGEIGFLETDHFRNQIKQYLPSTNLQCAVVDVPELPTPVVERLGHERTVGDVLDVNLTNLARSTGLSMGEAADVRRRLLGLPPRS